MTSSDSKVCDFKLPTGSSTIQSEPQTDNHSHSHSHDQGHSHSTPAKEHGHTHEIMDGPGKFTERDMPNHEGRDWNERAFTIGIGG